MMTREKYSLVLAKSQAAKTGSGSNYESTAIRSAGRSVVKTK